MNSDVPVPEILVPKSFCLRYDSRAGRNSFIIVNFQNVGLCAFRMCRLMNHAAPQALPVTIVRQLLNVFIVPDTSEWCLKTHNTTITIILTVVAQHANIAFVPDSSECRSPKSLGIMDDYCMRERL